MHLQKYIPYFSNKHPCRLLNFETVRCRAYKRAALIRGGPLFQN